MQEERKQQRQEEWIREIPSHLKPLLNQMIGNLSSFYQSLCKKGIYLPEKGSKAIHGEYLWKVFTNQVYCPLRREVQVGHMKEKMSKIELLELIEEEIKPTSIGLDEEHLPEL